MKKFLLKIFFVLFPIMLFFGSIIYIDFFKVFRNYDNYNSNNFIAINREAVTTNTYLNRRNIEKYDSYIFGSSRSQAFKCKYWNNYLPITSKPFHFDASGDGVYGVSNKTRLINNLGDTINNALVIIDREFLKRTENREGHLFVSPPVLSNESKLNYYRMFLNASINAKFIVAYFDYSLLGTYRNYMKGIIKEYKTFNKHDKFTGDVWYGYVHYIKEDSVGYYNDLQKKGTFYDRPKKESKPCPITNMEIEQLKFIKQIFDSHQTNYKIVISPIYDQIPLEEDQLELLNSIFGSQNIYNFSGVNDFTNYIGNYYESSHYKTLVANKILDSIYPTHSGQNINSH